MGKTHFFPRNHPIDAPPFEAFYNGSWHYIDHVSVKGGRLSVQSDQPAFKTEEKIHSNNLRLRSRKARNIDCMFLRPGIDVCVRSKHQDAENSIKELLPVWHDAKIISIERKPHDGLCACLFSVSFYSGKNPLKREPKLSVVVVTIDNIAILQKLQGESCQDGFSSWNSSEDCVSIHKNKLLSGTFYSEVSWLIVISTLKGIDFDIRFTQNKIVYQILNDDLGSSSATDVQSPSSVKNARVVIFQQSNGTTVPKVMTLPFSTGKVDFTAGIMESKLDTEMYYDFMDVRRSKRLKIIPDRFAVCNSAPNLKHCSTRPMIYELNISEQQKESSPTSSGSSSQPTASTSLLMQKDLNSDNLQHISPVKSQEDPLANESCGTPAIQKRKKIPGREHTAFHSQHPIIPEVAGICKYQQRISDRRLKQKGLQKRVPGGRRSTLSNIHSLSFQFEWKRYSETKTHREKFLSAADCKLMMEECMENIKSKIEKQSPPIVVPFEANHLINSHGERLDIDWTPSIDSHNEDLEHEDLWKEMEYTFAVLPFLEENQELSMESSNRILSNSNKGCEQSCRHDYIVDEEIGVICQLCNYICTEIRYVSPPFLQGDGWIRQKEETETELGFMWPNVFKSDPVSNVISSKDISILEGYHNIWTLIPKLKEKLQFHQKKAFEFLWRNIGGFLKPEDSDYLSEKSGGCIISHSPGTGKTLLVISFLSSYLRMFPEQRPLILAPKIALYVWCEEFKKWGISDPIYRIDPFETYKKDEWNYKLRLSPADELKSNKKTMHIMDCLEKLQKWHDEPSVLLMSYSSFFSLTRENSNFEHRRFMAEVLLKSPGILILDEGHNPRSTRSKLRKRLMKVSTNMRILLSGTLFQNNFEEYFNTLSLARPCFIHDTFKELNEDMVTDSSRKRGKKIYCTEKVSRKLFVQEIGKRIESSTEEERIQGFQKLMKITDGFVDAFSGETLSRLPGLQIYTLILNSTEAQELILSRLQRLIKNKRCPLELELLITLGSIHPWLITTVSCVTNYFNMDELDDIGKCKYDFIKGSKMKFVIKLVHKSVINREKVLIFCHNIPPINLLVEMFKIIFGWRIGEEILVLQGDQEFYERAKMIDKFKGDFRETSKILIASTTACAEGISLTAASRVILLDSEWNHSKTKQAIARAFRPGQTRMVYVYRLLSSGTWEVEKYNSNEFKDWLSKMIFIGRYIKRSFSRQVENIDDEVLRELVEEDQTKAFQMVLRND